MDTPRRGQGREAPGSRELVAVQSMIEGGAIHSSNRAIGRASLEMMAEALERAARAVKEALAEASV